MNSSGSTAINFLQSDASYNIKCLFRIFVGATTLKDHGDSVEAVWFKMDPMFELRECAING